jgi:F-type H+-transporting ATPase subunit delta
MSVGSIAKRYARAILELAKESGQLEQVGTELADFAKQWDDSEELRSIFLNPDIKLTDRKAILAEVATRAGLSTVTRNSILYINDQGRIAALPQIARAFAEQAGEASGVVRAEVTSASPLSETYYAQLQKTLEQVTGHKVSIEKKTDPNLIAGVVTRVGDKVFDGSIRSRLADLKDTLRGV